MGLWIHRATRADRLATGLGELLRTPLPDPFATEIVAVPTRGVERWLAQSLSHLLGGSAGDDGGDGICAGVSFPSPERMVADAVARITGIDPAADPWHPRRVVWPLLSVIDDARDAEWARPLWRYLDRPADLDADAAHGLLTDPNAAADRIPAISSAGRRYGTAHHLAELLDRYAAERPQMLQHWLSGADLDGLDRPLPPAMAWQAELWRRLRAEIDAPSRAEQLRAACAALVADPGRADLPARVSVFGPTRLAYATRALLAALARHRDVHLWLPHASPRLWSAVAGGLVRADGAAFAGDPTLLLPEPTGVRADDPTADLARHRLLGYLGRDAREFQIGLSRLPVDQHDELLEPAGAGDPRSAPGHRPTLLSRLQHELADDRPLPAPGPVAAIEPGDDSLTVHAAHGPDRQVEVLRELLLGLLQDDPTLEPRDIIVMCPDIETFAPLISAAFGAQTAEDDEHAAAGHPGHRLQVRLADRSLRQVNPLLQVLSRLFDLADSRAEASALVDLCATEPVAARFDLTPEDLLRLRELVGAAGVRWGLDGRHRQRFGMGAFAQNTWSAGLDRMLLGVAMDEDGEHFIGTTLPMDDVDAGDVDLVGRTAEFVHRLRSVLTRFDRPQSLRSWIAGCRQALELLTAVPPAEDWQTGQAYGELARIADTAAGRDDVDLSRREVRAVLAELFAGRPSRANFRTGTLTVATLAPMRSVPHRVVCLLGLDDGVFPRAGSLDGDDLLAVEPWLGDRDRRSEDRQLLLDAIMSATDHLVIVYSGADPRTNAERPPSVPLGELLDVLDQTAVAEDGGPVRDRIVHHHPLQPFDQRNFRADPDGAGRSRPFSFDPDGLDGARATVRPRHDPQPVYSTAPLPPRPLPAQITLTDLAGFLTHPVRSFLRTRAGLTLHEDEPPFVDEMPIELDGLDSWSIGDRMLRRHLAGIAIDQLVGAEWRRGDLPPRTIGSRTLEPVARNVAAVADRARPLLGEHPRTVDIAADIELSEPGGGTSRHTVVGTVPGVHDTTLVNVHYSRLGAKHRLQSWVRLLAMTATDPAGWQAVTVGRGDARSGGTSTLGPVGPEFATRALADLVDLYRTGMREPLPLPTQVAAEYARLRLEDRPIQPVRDRLALLWKRDADNYYRAFFGADFDLADLLGLASVPGEARGALAEPGRFATLARRVWHPLLTCEVIS